MSTSKQTSDHVTIQNWAEARGSVPITMKTFFFLVACSFLISCNQPPRGGDPVGRDSIGDPIDSIDTAGGNLYPDSATDTTKLEF